MSAGVSLIPAVRESQSPASRDHWAGLLVVDKPTGMTSHDVVDRARRRLKTRGVGHLGTLDPAASGLLLLAVGAATRCAAVWQGGEKTYEATLRFGVVTSTQDMTGEVLERNDVNLDEPTVRAAARGMVGNLSQVPPMVSARHVGGERLYRLARRGIEVEREARPIRVAEWEWLEFALPTARFRVRCSGGTYVRTLAHDLGRSLGIGAALEALRRVRSEPFGLERSATLTDLTNLDSAAVRERGGFELEEALGVLHAIELDAKEIDALGFGRATEVTADRVRPPRLRTASAPAPIEGGARSVAFLGPGGVALALGELRRVSPDGARLLAQPHVVFPWSSHQGRS